MLRVADSINRAHKETSGVCVVLENVAGGVRPTPFICQTCTALIATRLMCINVRCSNSPAIAFPCASAPVRRHCMAQLVSQAEAPVLARRPCGGAVQVVALSSCASG